VLIKINGPRYQRSKDTVDPLEQYDDKISDAQEKERLARTRLSPRELREVAESFELAGVSVKTKVTDDECTVTFSRWKADAKRTAKFSMAVLPWESQARAIFRNLAEAVRC